MDRLRTVATFVAGVLVGGGAVYFSPPEGGDAMSVPPGAGGMPAGPPSGQGMPNGDPAMAGGAPGQPGMMPGTPGQQPGQLPGDGAIPATGQPGGPVVDPTIAATSMGQPGSVPEGVHPSNPQAAAEGPPLDDVPAAPPGTMQQSGGRLEKHIRTASTLWGHLKDQAEGSKNPAAKALVVQIESHIESLPTIGEHMPPMQEVASYLASSRILLDRMEAAGLDVAEMSLQIDTLMRPPRGKIPGGPKAEAGK